MLLPGRLPVCYPAVGVPEHDSAVLARAGQLAVCGIIGQGIRRLAVALVGRARQQLPWSCATRSIQSATDFPDTCEEVPQDSIHCHLAVSTISMQQDA